MPPQFRLGNRQWFVILVLLPTALAAIYYAFIASDIYVSESRFVIKSPGSRPTQFSTLANVLQTTGLSAGQEQANQVIDYVGSRDAMRDLGHMVDFKEIYGAKDIDFLDRYPGLLHTDNRERLYKYYKQMVNTRLDQDTGSVVLTVKAFTPKAAFGINERLLDLSENVVNRLSERAQSTGIADAIRRRDEAAARLRRASLALTQYRSQQEVVDPAKQAVGGIELVNQLIAQRSLLLAQLSVMERSTPDNPSIPAVQRQISAASAQIAALQGDVVGQSGGGIASKIGKYEDLQVERQFATQMLTTTEASLAQARSEAQSQQFYLERIVQPDLPDIATLPNGFRQVIVIFAALSCLYLIGWMLLVGVLEHAGDS